MKDLDLQLDSQSMYSWDLAAYLSMNEFCIYILRICFPDDDDKGSNYSFHLLGLDCGRYYFNYITCR